MCGEREEEDEVEVTNNSESVGSDSVEVVVVLEDISVLESSGMEHGETVEQAPDHTESDDVDDVVTEEVYNRQIDTEVDEYERNKSLHRMIKSDLSEKQIIYKE